MADADTSIETQQSIISTELHIVNAALVSPEVERSIVWDYIGPTYKKSGNVQIVLHLCMDLSIKYLCMFM